MTPLEEAAGWEYRHLAALVKKVGGSDNARRLLSCDGVGVKIEGGAKRAVITAVEPEAPRLNIGAARAFEPKRFLGSRWKSVWRDERSLTLEVVDFRKVRFETGLRAGERLVDGEEKLKRHKESEDILLGGNVFFALWLDYQINGENSVLEWLRKNKDVTLIYFFGLVLQNQHGDRYALYLCWDVGSERWYWHYFCLGHNFDIPSPSALLAS